MKRLIFGFYLLITCASTSLPLKGYKLQSVSVAFRHGDRTPDAYPTESYPNDPYLNEPFDPIGRAGLTNTGKRREYDLGLKLRKLYHDFLSNEYKSHEVSVISTPVQRTKMSLLLVLASLYVPTDRQKWNEDLDWQPVPADALVENLPSFLRPEICPTYINELELVKNTDEYKKDASRFDELKKNLTILTGRNMSDLHTVYKLYLTLVTEFSMNLTLPKWTKPYFPKGPVHDAALFEYETQSYTTALKKLNGGLFIRKVLSDNVYEKKADSIKLFLYSMHESNIAGILYALNLWNYETPPFGSAVILEFYTNRYKIFIRTLWYKGIPAEAELQIIPGCLEYCPLKDFIRILADVIPTDTINSCLGPPEKSLFIPKSVNPIVWIYEQIKRWFNI